MTYDAFIDAVHDRLSVDDRDDAAHIAVVILETFSEILYRTERDKLCAPLAKELKQPLKRAKTETSRRDTKRLNASAFLDRIQARANLNREEAQTATTVVIDVLRDASDEAILSEIGNHLPSSYTSLFPFMGRRTSESS